MTAAAMFSLRAERVPGGRFVEERAVGSRQSGMESLCSFTSAWRRRSSRPAMIRT